VTDLTKITDEVLNLTMRWEQRLLSLPPDLIVSKRNKQDRTVRQILGHLCDSTSNNIHRIVHLQYQPAPLTFPNYGSFGNNDRWIAIQNYQDEDWHKLVMYWKYSVIHLCHVIRNIDLGKLDAEWIAGPDRPISLEMMIIDFLRHFKLHLDEIEELIR
jgi:hypothetical protein